MRTVSDRVIGICDTPTELFEETARALDLHRRCAFDYFGLNHLGLAARGRRDGEPQLQRLWNDPSVCNPSTECRCSTRRRSAR